MMRNFVFFVLAAVGTHQNVSGTSWITCADDITDEWLVETGAQTGYTEHVRHFKILFENMPVDTFIEFGVGFSTKYFIDRSEKVVSVEFVTPGGGPEWLQYCIDLYRDYSTWQPIAYFAGDGLDTSWAPYKYMGADSVYQAAAYQPWAYKSYALIDPSFLDDLSNFVEQQVNANTVDVAFVDAGVCIRGDLVQTLFDKVPVIAAHDIAPPNKRFPDAYGDPYGYGRIRVPDNYEEIHVIEGMGTSFWVLKDAKHSGVAQALRNYAASF